jgi:peptide/nickel transport system substrate-binding protein
MNRRELLEAAAAGAGSVLIGNAASGQLLPRGASPSILAFRRIPVESGRLIQDPLRVPRSYQEAPELAARVREGKLPPVGERLGQDPIVIEPLESIGAYGGTLRRAFVGPADFSGPLRFASGPDSLLYWDDRWQRVVPNIARSFELRDAGRVLVIALRRGMHWSDGAPFTADDILFWYEDMYLDRRVVASASGSLQVAGRDVLVRKLDSFTVEFVSPEPYPTLPEVLASFTDMGGPSVSGRSGLGGYAPRHYLSRFHPKYRSEAALEREAREAGFANWSIHLRNRNDWLNNTELPVVSPWRVVKPINQRELVLDRNAFSIWVDTAGNQLPYVGRIVHELCSRPDVVTSKAASGSLDLQDRHLSITSLPFLLRNRQRFGYDVHLDPYEGVDIALRFNLDYRQDPVIGSLLANTQFRRALSLAVDRKAINETLVLGTGLETSSVCAPTNRFYPGDDWARRWARLDVNEANALLDGIGLARRTDGGLRQRADGSGPVRLTCHAVNAHFDYAAAAEMVRENLLRVGIDLDIRNVETNLFLKMTAANEIQLAIQAAIMEDPLNSLDFIFPSTALLSGGVFGVELAKWFQSNGSRGRRPPEYVVEMIELWRRGRGLPASERLEIGRELIRRHVDNVLSIGLVSNGLLLYGIRVANRDLANVPRRIINTTMLKSPINSLPMTFFYRSLAARPDAKGG